MAKSQYKKRSDGRYRANVFTGKIDEFGKREYIAVYARTEQNLKDKISEIRDSVNKGTYADDKKMKVKGLAEKWYMTEKAVCGIRSKEMYDRLTYKHIIPAIGEIRLRELKKSDVQKMINDRADKRRTCEQLKMATIQMLDFGIEDGLLYKNVALKVSLPPKLKSEKRALNDLEKKAIKKANFTEKEKAFIYILLYCGLRRGEILALSQADISLVTKKINISNVVTFDISKPVLKFMPKTESGFRSVPITLELEKVLAPYLDNLKTYYLFESVNGGLMSKSTYDDFWKRILEKINVAAGGTATKKVNINASKKDNDNKPIKAKYKEIKGLQVIHGLSAHVFRHNYATMLYYANVPIKDAQYLLGHSNIKITLDIYTHLDQSKNDIADKLNTISAL